MYINWDIKVSSILSYHWVHIPTLTTYLQNLRHIIIYSSQQISASHLPKLTEISVPCTVNQRFPNNFNYICEVSEWKNELNLLQLTLNVIINYKKLEREYPTFKTIGEAEFFALKKISHILHLLHEGDDIMSQEAFENFYDLFWEDRSTDESFDIVWEAPIIEEPCITIDTEPCITINTDPNGKKPLSSFLFVTLNLAYWCLYQVVTIPTEIFITVISILWWPFKNAKMFIAWNFLVLVLFMLSYQANKYNEIQSQKLAQLKSHHNKENSENLFIKENKKLLLKPQASENGDLFVIKVMEEEDSTSFLTRIQETFLYIRNKYLS